MDCEQNDIIMMKYFEGDLDDIEKTQFANHLNSCPACDKGFSIMEKIFCDSENPNCIHPPDNFEKIVINKINRLNSRGGKLKMRLLFLLYCLTAIVAIPLLLVYVIDISLRDLLASLVFVFNKILTPEIFIDIIALIANSLFQVFVGAVSVLYKAYLNLSAELSYILALLGALAAGVRYLPYASSSQIRRKAS